LQLFLDGHSMKTKGMKMKSHCKGRTKAGKACGAAASDGGLCFFHANPNKASELGRIGGRSHGHAVAEGGDLLAPLDNAVALRDAVGRLIADVLAGKIDPKVAAVLPPLLTLQLNAIRVADVARQLAAVEQQSKLERQSKLGDGTSE
jgi:hypothetical protein